MRWNVFGVGLALLAASLPGQHAAHPPSHDRATGDRHHPRTTLTPDDVLRHLVTGHQLFVHERATGVRPFEAERPPGGGRHLAAILVDTEIVHDAGTLLGQRYRDLLVLSSPGPCARGAEVARIERAVREDDLPLCVILVAQASASLAPAIDGERPDDLQRRTDAARRLAAHSEIPVATAQVLAQGRLLLAASALLRERNAAGRTRIIGGVVDPTTATIQWLPHWVEQRVELPGRKRRSDRPLQGDGQEATSPARGNAQPSPQPSPRQRQDRGH